MGQDTQDQTSVGCWWHPVRRWTISTGAGLRLFELPKNRSILGENVAKCKPEFPIASHIIRDENQHGPGGNAHTMRGYFTSRLAKLSLPVNPIRHHLYQTTANPLLSQALSWSIVLRPPPNVLGTCRPHDPTISANLWNLWKSSSWRRYSGNPNVDNKSTLWADISSEKDFETARSFLCAVIVGMYVEIQWGEVNRNSTIPTTVPRRTWFDRYQ